MLTPPLCIVINDDPHGLRHQQWKPFSMCTKVRLLNVIERLAQICGSTKQLAVSHCKCLGAEHHPVISKTDQATVKQCIKRGN